MGTLIGSRLKSKKDHHSIDRRKEKYPFLVTRIFYFFWAVFHPSLNFSIFLEIIITRSYNLQFKQNYHLLYIAKKKNISHSKKKKKKTPQKKKKKKKKKKS